MALREFGGRCSRGHDDDRIRPRALRVVVTCRFGSGPRWSEVIRRP